MSIECFETIITTLNRKRTIRVYLPSDYDTSPKIYDVLYMHDGHNLFFKETSAYGHIWNVHKALDEFEKNFKVNIIVVGIDCSNTNRFEEYCPWENLNLGKLIPIYKNEKHGGEGDLYLDWLVNTLIKEINVRYRTTNKCFMAGSSMGGLISLYAGLKYYPVFKKIGCFSGAFWFAKKEIMDYIRNNPQKDLGVYLDIGTNETSNTANKQFNQIYVDDSIDVYELLNEQKTKNLKFIIDEGAIHSEIEWEKRFPIFLEWLLLKNE